VCSLRTKFFLLSVLLISDLAAEQLAYTLSVDETTFQYVKVNITVKQTNHRRLRFSMPSWIPGAYEWRSFGDQVIRFSAVDSSGSSVRWEKLSRSDWEVQPTSSQVQVDYLLKPAGRFWWGTSLDSTGALLEGASTWMVIHNLERVPISIRLQTPASWTVSTALPMVGQNDYQASGYDELADCPILLGRLSDTTFTVSGAEHAVYFFGQTDFDRKAFIAMVHRIVAEQARLMQGLPYSRYTFQYILSADERGSSGLEHATSTTIRLSALEVMKEVHRAAGITSHEFFHLWNVKRLTSAALQPLNYHQEARTESLWWFEGVTSYYADLTLLRCGIWSMDEFLKSLALEIEQLQGNPDRLKTTVAQASWRVWQNGLANPGISYYNKGYLVGLLLDLVIRKVTDNKKSLDHVMRYLYHNYGVSRRGIRDDEWPFLLLQATGKDFMPFFDRYIYGLVELPYEDILAIAGLQATLATKSVPTIGRIRILGPRNRVYSLDETSAAGRAGLRRNDLILSVDGQTVSDETSLEQRVAMMTIGQTALLRISRDGREMVLPVTVEGLEKTTCSLSPLAHPSEQALRIRTSWTTGK